MTYATAIPELFRRLPEMHDRYLTELDYMGDEAPLPYSVFGSILIPKLAKSLEDHNLRSILSICAYLEDAAVSSANDKRLAELLGIEVGEWLGWAANEELLAPWLGVETKRVCGYVPGLATQRRKLKQEQNGRSIRNKFVLLKTKLLHRTK